MGNSAGRVSPFERIRQIDEDANDFWSARDLAKVVGYTECGKFKHAFQKAETAYETSGQPNTDHFAHVSEMIRVGKGAQAEATLGHADRPLLRHLRLVHAPALDAPTMKFKTASIEQTSRLLPC